MSGAPPALRGGGPRGRFPPSQRVRKRAEFQAIQAGARRVSTPHLVALLRAVSPPDPARTSARLGLTVSRKVGNAVVRTRVKRLLREAFRSTRELWHPELDVVLVSRRSPVPDALATLVEELRGAERSIARRTKEALRDRKDAPGGWKSPG